MRMKLPRELRPAVALLLATGLACTPAQGLVTFNGGHDHLYVTGNLGVAYDSNIFANNVSDGDTIYTASVLAEYARKAGWIAVNGSLEVEASRFAGHTAENFTNPKMSLELTKQGGRTTGSLLLNAARESRADPTVNLRNESWNYGVSLNAKYPVIERYSLSGSLSYSLVDYIDNALYVDLRSYGATADLFYVLSKERDLVAGYRYRDNQSSVNTSTEDHAFTAGVSGRIVRGYNGSLRVGYQTRHPQKTSDVSFGSWTGSASVTHGFSKKLSLTAVGSKDFSTTATNTNVDVTTFSTDLQYAFNARWVAHGGLAYSNTRFLGLRGIDVTTGRSRADTMLQGDVGVTYSASEHFKLSLSYLWSENWSTLAYSDFIRTNWSLNLSSRW
jgi:hypothetical protein